MQARMTHPTTILPEAMQALQALGRSTRAAGVPARTLELVNLRASQINGCSVCVEMPARDLKRAGESDERARAGLILAVANINVWNRLNVATRQVAGTIATRSVA
jgi:AhpD family alkylhydroperoxidase